MSLFILRTGQVILAAGKKAIKKALERGAKKATAEQKKKIMESGNISTWGPKAPKGPRGEIKYIDKPSKGPVLKPGEKYDPFMSRKSKGGLMVKPKLAKRGW